MSSPVHDARKAAHGTTAEVLARLGLGSRAFLRIGARRGL